jgi:hypothetical protein
MSLPYAVIQSVNPGFNDGATLADLKGILLGSEIESEHISTKTPDDETARDSSLCWRA